MSRPLVEFIHAPDMPWDNTPLSPARADVAHKLLSLDGDTGASSLLVKYPAGWQRTAPESLAAEEEIFVLDGTLTLDGEDFGPGDYTCLPKGYPRQSAVSADGAVALTFFSAKPVALKNASSNDDHAHVPRQSLYGDGWDADYAGVNSPEIAGSGSRKKLLRTDPVTGDQTWLMGVIPSYREKRVESHPVVQECYMVWGEMSGNTGLLVTGSYFWRPPEILHGPYGSKTGAIILSRTEGGSLTVDYYDLDEPFRHDPPHRVMVGEEVAVYAQPKRPTPRY
ncbi:MAG: DUF4437 domain-containing protein [Proteobacteria bacterium]|nr:DUF4437 domain-containing protein [Pseudomonadota bacterium]MDA1059414.1 DUF4437 domain-containing protein [Pseudomonadota bacterium]